MLLALVCLAAVQAPRAAAVDDAEELVRFGSLGSGAGQLNLPIGVATDPTTGHVITAEEGGNRVSEFTPWGKFVKAFGWDVAPGAVNEQQEVRVRAGGGVLGLKFEGAETAPLPVRRQRKRSRRGAERAFDDRRCRGQRQRRRGAGESQRRHALHLRGRVQGLDGRQK